MALMWNRTVDWDADDWRRSAACRNTEPDLFFPVGTTGPAVDQIEAAKRVCRSCEALEPCLDFALATNQESGVWGGTSEEERRKLRKAWLAARRSQRAAIVPLSPARTTDAHRGARTGTEIATRVPPPSAGRQPGSMVIVPSSWLTTRSRTMERPRLVVRSMSKPSGSPEPSSRTSTRSDGLVAREREVDVTHGRVAGRTARPSRPGRAVAARRPPRGRRRAPRRSAAARPPSPPAASPRRPPPRPGRRAPRSRWAARTPPSPRPSAPASRRSRRRGPGRSGHARGSRAPARWSGRGAPPRAGPPGPPGRRPAAPAG